MEQATGKPRGAVSPAQFKAGLADFMSGWIEGVYHCTVCDGQEAGFRRHELLAEPFVCHSCSERKETELRTRWDRTVEWNKECPKAFRDSDWKLLPCRHLINEVQSWKYGRRGILFHGSPGTGKTRLAYILLKRLHAEGHVVKAMTATDFALGVQEHGGAHTLPAWLKELSTVPILLLDDLGKEKLSESVVTHLFHVLDKRMSREAPVLVTTNYRAESFVERFGECGQPLYRRLKESCIVVAVTAITQQEAA
jgi:DNA replication protein DnaC